MKKATIIQLIKKVKLTQFIKPIYLILIIINSNNVLNNKTKENNIKLFN